MIYMRLTIGIAGIFLVCLSTAAQEFPRSEPEYDSLYARNILLEEIDGIYIPKDLQDAFAELKRLSSPQDIEKFRKAPEELMRTKLHFGLGRWMIVNWAFYEGSRFAYFLREAGLEHPDDMARVVIVCFHRHLNQQPLHFDEEVIYYHALREKERQQRESRKEVISEEKVRKD
jgi:hypothetical protein